MGYTEHQFHSLKGQSTQVLFGTVSAKTSVERLMCLTAALTKHSFSATKHSTSVCVFICDLKHRYTKSTLSAYLHTCMCVKHVEMMFDTASRWRKTHLQASKAFNVCVCELICFLSKMLFYCSSAWRFEVCRRECRKTRQTNRWEERGGEKNTHTTYYM